jgi:pyridoxal phosphate enzyme (YggS family)
MTRAELQRRLVDRLHAVEERIAAACARAGRQRRDVTLVAVTKTASVEAATALTELGVLDLGESRPQELWHKAEEIRGAIRWHLIGHLQRNKITRTLPLVFRIHSVDSVRLLDALDQEAGEAGVDVLLEVNASAEDQKHGFDPSALSAALAFLSGLRRVRVTGLMTMAALEEDAERCRPTFARLRELRDRLAPSVSPPHSLRDLSMGMTNDFEVAIEEGATMVRIGSALFADLERE